MAIIDIDYLRKQLLLLAKTEEERREINLALAGLSGEIELLTTAEIGRLLGVSGEAIEQRARKLRKRGYRLGIRASRTWYYQFAEIELIKHCKWLVGIPTKEGKNELATN